MGLFNSIFGGGSNTAAIQEMLNNGALVVDVRTRSEFQGGHVAGSKNFPLQEIQGKVADLKKIGKPIVLCCASGNRSGQATRFLKEQGIQCENGGGWMQVNALV